MKVFLSFCIYGSSSHRNSPSGHLDKTWAAFLNRSQGRMGAKHSSLHLLIFYLVLLPPDAYEIKICIFFFNSCLSPLHHQHLWEVGGVAESPTLSSACWLQRVSLRDSGTPPAPNATSIRSVRPRPQRDRCITNHTEATFPSPGGLGFKALGMLIFISCHVCHFL